jgi:hypothetical protein
MSRKLLNRRQFVTLPIALALARVAARVPVASGVTDENRTGRYSAEVGLLYNTVTLRLDGTIEEHVDRPGGRYTVQIAGQGAGVASTIESTGLRRDGVWAPTHTVSHFEVRGRPSHSEMVYDYGQRRVEYHFRGETFLLRRLRVVDDGLAIPPGLHLDDVISAMLNYADGGWRADPDGTYRTSVLRRRRRDNEAPDDVDPHARAEIVPFALTVMADAATGKSSAEFDMSRFSSWARAARPASIQFTASRRPEVISSALILGTSLTIRFHDV